VNKEELMESEEWKKFLHFLDIVGNIVLAVIGLLGVIIFASGFRFLNSYDTVVRLAFGGAITAVISIYFIRCYRRYRRWRLGQDFWRQLR